MKTLCRVWLTLGAAFGLWAACGQPSQTHAPPAPPVAAAQKAFKNPFPDTVFTAQIGRVAVDLRFPKTDTLAGTLLVFPGWNFPRQDWCNRSSLCQKALAQGYALVLPEMGKSNFLSQIYPETRSDWRQYPALHWVTDTLIVHIQEKYGLLQAGQPNFMVGLSTGGRGVALAGLALPQLFTAAAALSGDFDMRLLPNDRIMLGSYGPPQQFPERWAGADNAVRNAARFQTPLYLGHGLKDKVCPPEQSRVFADTLKALHPNLPLRLNFPPNAAHDYAYWDSEVEPVLPFFKEMTLRRQKP